MDFDHLKSTAESLTNAGKQALTFPPIELKHQWNASFAKAGPGHRLTLLYFANEVLQRSRRTHGSSYLDECFGPMLPPAFEALLKQKPEYKDKLIRMLNVWQERGVTSVIENEAIQKVLNGEDGVSPVSNKRARHLESLEVIVNTGADLALDVEVVKVSTNMSAPFQFDETLTEMNGAEAESVMDGLDAENVHRSALRLYKILKAKGDVAAERLGILPQPKSLEKREEHVRKGESEAYTVVETVETVNVDLKELQNILQMRIGKLDSQLGRSERVLMSLASMLDLVQTTNLHEHDAKFAEELARLNPAYSDADRLSIELARIEADKQRESKKSIVQPSRWKLSGNVQPGTATMTQIISPPAAGIAPQSIQVPTPSTSSPTLSWLAPRSSYAIQPVQTAWMAPTLPPAHAAAPWSAPPAPYGLPATSGWQPPTEAAPIQWMPPQYGQQQQQQQQQQQYAPQGYVPHVAPRPSQPPPYQQRR